jgi:type II secretory pathway predicted ATPase ExeA
MYRQYYGLRERPFDLTPNPRFMVLTDAHREALSNLEYGIASRKGITVLLGEAGTGKTTVLRMALERQPERVHCVYLQNPALTRTEFVEMLAVRFDLGAEAARSKTALLLRLEELLRARREQGESTVLVVDEAQSLPLELLEELRLLVNIETDEEKLLSVVLAGQPELADRLNRSELRQLKQRVALRCELRPLTTVEGLAYVAGRIRAAGGVGAQIFTREAVMLMHARARGIPRTLSVIADNALVTGFATDQRPIRAAVIDEVCRDMDLEAFADEPASSPEPEHEPEPLPTPVEERKHMLSFAAPPPATERASDDPAPALRADPAPDLETAGSEPEAQARRRFGLF